MFERIRIMRVLRFFNNKCEAKAPLARVCLMPPSLAQIFPAVAASAAQSVRSTLSHAIILQCRPALTLGLIFPPISQMVRRGSSRHQEDQGVLPVVATTRCKGIAAGCVKQTVFRLSFSPRTPICRCFPKQRSTRHNPSFSAFL